VNGKPKTRMEKDGNSAKKKSEKKVRYAHNFRLFSGTLQSGL